MKKRPNIICIMSDEHDPNVSSVYGDKFSNTSALDSLANDGITFDNAYTTSPLCVPARLSFTAGKYVSRCGAWNNQSQLESDNIPSVMSQLNKVGYDTFLCGKMHYAKNRRYGFTYDLIPSHNNSIKFLNSGRRFPDDKVPDLKNWYTRSEKFYPSDSSVGMKKDTLRTEKAIEVIKNRKEDDNPIFLMLGYIAPHFPLIAPQKYYEKYKDKIPMPELPTDFIENLPLNYRHLRMGFGFENTENEIVKLGRELYWAFVEWMDDEIAKVIDALKNSNIKDNTVVIYTSDHGENKGDHGMWWKNNMYEHSSRIPLIISYPSKWKGNQRRAGACSLVDLSKTILDIAQAEIPDDWDGDSLLKYMDNPDEPWKNFAVSEYYGHNTYTNITMLRKGNFKYVYHAQIDPKYPAERELYNLLEDPKEFNNLAKFPEYSDKIKEMHDFLVEELGADPDDNERNYRTKIGTNKMNFLLKNQRILARLTNIRYKRKIKKRKLNLRNI